MKRLPALKWLLAAALAAVPYVLLSFQRSSERVSYTQSIRPIFKKHCLSCHTGPDAAGQLDLSTKTGIQKGGVSGELFKHGEATKTLLWSRLTATKATVMPPSGRLSDADLATVRRWIQEGAVVDAPLVTYAKDIASIFKAHCLSCHQGDQAKAGLDLSNASWITDRLINLDRPDSSELLVRLRGLGNKPRMPLGFASVRGEDIDKIRMWIAEGASTDGGSEEPHWAYVSPRRVAPPGRGNPIDAFVGARLKSAGLSPGPRADTAALVRRLYLDLTGLPPTPAQMDEILKNRSPRALDTLVERLLKNPAHGERMARIWLDLARYADSKGFEADRNREMWRYRDWVIEAFNQNMPYDRFSREQLAGDLLPDPTLDQLISTGFHRNTMMNEEGGVDPGEQHFDVVMDRANTTSSVWLGSTMACARCHDHKFDPISQKDYFALVAYFDNADYEKRGDSSVGQEKWYEPEIEAPTPDIAPRLDKLSQEVSRAKAELELALMSAEFQASFVEWLTEESAPRRSPRIFSITSPNAEVFRTLTDDSIKVEGNNPRQTRYSLTFNLAPDATGVRIEALPDRSLKGSGSGRSSGGNFLLTGVSVRGVARQIPQIRVGVDFNQAGYNVQDVLRMEKADKGWAVYPYANQPHELVLEFEEPLGEDEAEWAWLGGAAYGPSLRGNTDGITVELTLAFESPWEQHGLGRFRISPTFAKDPISRILSSESRLALINQSRSAEQTARLQRDFARISPILKPSVSRVESLERQIAELKRTVPKALIMRDRPKIATLKTHLRNRGEFLNLGEEVEAAPPGFVNMKKAPREDRLSLAKWLFDRQNPLTARVQVNRLWEMFFGEGLVKTMEDFGTQGDPPSHPELLDWLAVEFMDRGWDNQAIIRLIVSSDTYRQSAASNRRGLAVDPNNALLWRGPRFRMEAEMVRDAMLSIGGVLNTKLGGPSVYPDQPPGIWDTPYNGEQWMTSERNDRFRRSLYTFWKRSSTFPMFMAFDATSREQCTARRIRTNTPLQALALMNDVAMMEAARGLATLMLREGGIGETDKLRYGFRRCTSRLPNKNELARLTDLLTSLRKKMALNPSANKIAKDPETAVWTMVANTLLNLDETITKG